MERQVLVLTGSACCNQVSCSHIPDQFEKHTKYNSIIGHHRNCYEWFGPLDTYLETTRMCEWLKLAALVCTGLHPCSSMVVMIQSHQSPQKGRWTYFDMHPCPVSICPAIQQGVIIFKPVPLSSIRILQLLWSWIVISIPSYVQKWELKHQIISIRHTSLF